jgi:hypothetical protein
MESRKKGLQYGGDDWFRAGSSTLGYGNGIMVLTKGSGDGPAVMIFGEKGSSKRCSGLGGQPRTIRSYSDTA